ncbi:MAG: response regulator [Candidatus Staskawiczbacteria bacterium]|nr:response regulator [Candidatus Staskawiczbacteria bacterium]
MSENKKILVVEDDSVLRNTIIDKLTSEGFEALGAKNGQEGLDLALQAHPDLILVDILMPVMDGMEMTTKLREDEWGKDANIIVLTNLNDEKRIADFLEQGTYDYLVKSNWSLDEVVKKVKEKLNINT